MVWRLQSQTYNNPQIKPHICKHPGRNRITAQWECWFPLKALWAQELFLLPTLNSNHMPPITRCTHDASLLVFGMCLNEHTRSNNTIVFNSSQSGDFFFYNVFRFLLCFVFFSLKYVNPFSYVAQWTPQIFRKKVTDASSKVRFLNH